MSESDKQTQPSPEAGASAPPGEPTKRKRKKPLPTVAESNPSQKFERTLRVLKWVGGAALWIFWIVVGIGYCLSKVAEVQRKAEDAQRRFSEVKRNQELSRLSQRNAEAMRPISEFKPNPRLWGADGQDLADFMRRADLPAQIASDRTLDVQPAANVDEQLFMLRKLDFLYGKWPQDLEDREQAAQQLASAKHELVSNLEHVKAKGMQDRLVGMYSDSIQLADRYGPLLVAELNQAEFEREIELYSLEHSRLVGKLQAQAEALAEQLGWDRKEVGFDLHGEDARQFLEAVLRGDYALVQNRLEGLKRVRPRDPFLYAGVGEVFAQQAEILADQHHVQAAIAKHQAAVSEYLRAVELIPFGPFHDELRAEYLWNAAQNADMELYYSGEKGEQPITLANTALKYWPDDPVGQIRHTKAFALARNDFFDEAQKLYEQVGQVRKQDAQFHYGRACLRSMAGEFDDSIADLKAAWAQGYRAVRSMRQDRDLSEVRRAKQSEFGELIAPNWDWNIEYGSSQNNLTISNKSEYALTSLAVKATWKGKDGTMRTEVYWADALPAGETYTFQGVFDSATPGNTDGTACVANISSEELRDVDGVKGQDVLGQYSGIATPDEDWWH